MKIDESKCLGPKGAERLTFFSDAVVAIAITLLVIPLTELAVDDSVVTEGAIKETVSFSQIFQENYMTISAFIVSFYVVLIRWTAHRRLFDRAKRIDAYMAKWNSVYLLTIVSVPFASQLISGNVLEQNLIFYVALLLINCVSTWCIYNHLEKNPEFIEPSEAERTKVVLGWVDIIVLCAILLLSIIIPDNGKYSLFLLIIDGKKVDKLIKWFKKTDQNAGEQGVKQVTDQGAE